MREKENKIKRCIPKQEEKEEKKKAVTVLCFALAQSLSFSDEFSAGLKGAFHTRVCDYLLMFFLLFVFERGKLRTDSCNEALLRYLGDSKLFEKQEKLSNKKKEEESGQNSRKRFQKSENNNNNNKENKSKLEKKNSRERSHRDPENN